ncbi:MAG: ABC transporter permease [Chrysiogenetes bacterium]|nr:ABC transporter permease [Chrysiogenetes bacterium]
MNLALKDIAYRRTSFALTALGLGLLFTIVLAMGGVYRGLVDDATLLVNRMGADLWVVQAGTRGPFAEMSRVSVSLADRVRAVPGVARAQAFNTYTIQREHDRKLIRLSTVGLPWEQDRGEWIPLIAGRALRSPHYEMIADVSSGLHIGEKVELAGSLYTVVGLTKWMVSLAGDATAFMTLGDALEVQTYQPPAALRQARARNGGTDKLPPSPRPPAAPSPAESLRGGQVSAVMIYLEPGVAPEEVRARLAQWADISVYTAAEQHQLLIEGVVDKVRRQMGLIRGLLTAISTIIVMLIIYNMTNEKLHDIAMLKLMGARSRMIGGMVLQQAWMLGLLGYGFATLIGRQSFQYFPRRVILTDFDLVFLAALVLFITTLGSVVGIAKAIRVDPNVVLNG